MEEPKLWRYSITYRIGYSSKQHSVEVAAPAELRDVVDAAKIVRLTVRQQRALASVDGEEPDIVICSIEPIN